MSLPGWIVIIGLAAVFVFVVISWLKISGRDDHGRNH